MGPSGSGKTTILRALVGAQRITSGSIEVLGLPAGHRLLRRRIAYTSQSLSIYRDITVRDNVEYFAGLHSRSPEYATEAISRVDLTDHADRVVEKLSGGQASRVSLACALVGEPEFLVLDEPTVGLDPLTRTQLWDTFRRLAAGGTTLLISSHVMDEATHCDSVLLLREGHLLAHAPITDIQQRTSTDNAEDAFIALIEESV